MADYSITLVSGPGDGCGGIWVPDLHLTVFGTRASSHEFGLGTARALPGAPVTCEVRLTDLGDLQRLRVRHDDMGLGLGRYLDRIDIRAVDAPLAWTFPCRRWLARDRDDGATERMLSVVGGGASDASTYASHGVKEEPWGTSRIMPPRCGSLPSGR